MLSDPEKLTDKSLFICLNTITQADNATANDVMYHNLCWAKEKKKAEPKVKLADNYSKTLADNELNNFVETNIFQNSDIVLDMIFF